MSQIIYRFLIVLVVSSIVSCSNETKSTSSKLNASVPIGTELLSGGSQFLGGFCNKVSQCGVDTACGNEQCICRLGYVPAQNQIDCSPFKCDYPNLGQANSTAQCLAQFGDPNLFCNWNLCECSRSHEVDYHTQRCVSKYPAIDAVCPGGSCGEGAYCLPSGSSSSSENVCKCQFGNVQSPNGIDCERFECYYNSDCAQWAASTDPDSVRCDLKRLIKSAPSCTCTPNYDIDYVTQKCYKQLPSPPRGSNFWLIFVIVFCAVGCVLVAIGVYCCCVRMRRARTVPGSVIGGSSGGYPNNQAEMKSNPNNLNLYPQLPQAPPTYSVQRNN